MRIAMVINTSWNIYNFRKNLVDYLIDNGHELILIAPRDIYSEKLQNWEAQYIELPMDNTGSNPVNDLILFWRFLKLYKKVKPDVALHYTIKPNIYGSLAAGFLKVPCINNVSGLGTIFLKQNLSTHIARKLYSMAFRKHCHIFFQNPDDASDFRNQVSFTSSYSVIPGSGIDLKNHPSIHSSKQKSKEKQVFLMIGRLLIEKGVNEYIEAAEHFLDYKNVEFWLAGALDDTHVRGISHTFITNKKEAGVINYLGHVQPIMPIINQVDWVVLPSYREGTPRSLLEAATLAKPLITCDVPGCREVVVNGQNGFLCNSGDAKSLIEAIEKALNLDQKSISRMGKASRKLVEDKFDEKIVFKAYLAQIARMTGN